MSDIKAGDVWKYNGNTLEILADITEGSTAHHTSFKYNGITPTPHEPMPKWVNASWVNGGPIDGVEVIRGNRS